MNKIPTAEEFLLIKTGAISRSITDTMIEFAKLHVKAALEAANESAYAEEGYIGYNWSVNEESILNSYPYENIK